MAVDGNDMMEKLVALCKRRGFIFQSSEIYGGINGFWDYGPLGVELKRNVKEAWWNDIVRQRDNVVGLDCSIIMNPKVWEASGHIGGFSDPMVDDTETKDRYRADQLFGLFPFPGPDVPGFVDLAVEFIIKCNPDGTPRVEPCGVLEAGGLVEALNSLVADPKVLVIDKAKWGKLRKVIPIPPKEPGYVPKSDAWVQLEFASGAKSHAFIRQVPGEYWEHFEKHVPSPKTGKLGGLTKPRQFNLMFKTFVGAMEDSSSVAYLRPETAQGIFANYKNVLDTSRMKVPFGIAQQGKAFRNEINPRNYTFRSREFEQMEIEFFCHPKEADKWYEYWRNARYNWYVGLGLTSSKLHLRDHAKEELAHYARACADVEYEFPFGTSELEGIANRTDFDLSQHQKFSGKDLSYFDDDAWAEILAKRKADGLPDMTKEEKDKLIAEHRFIPYVIEPSGGVDRAALAFLCEAYCEDTAPDENGKQQSRTVMKFHPRLAPIKLAVFPLVKKDGMPEIAEKIHRDAQKAGLASFYDEKGAVGRRYRRQDEAGTPFCITVDGQTLQDQTVTVRDRDSLKQDRIAADAVVQYVKERIA